MIPLPVHGRRGRDLTCVVLVLALEPVWYEVAQDLESVEGLQLWTWVREQMQEQQLELTELRLLAKDQAPRHPVHVKVAEDRTGRKAG